MHTARKVLSGAENKKHKSRAQNNDTFKKFDGRILNSQKHGLLLCQADHIRKLYGIGNERWPHVALFLLLNINLGKKAWGLLSDFLENMEIMKKVNGPSFPSTR